MWTKSYLEKGIVLMILGLFFSCVEAFLNIRMLGKDDSAFAVTTVRSNKKALKMFLLQVVS